MSDKKRAPTPNRRPKKTPVPARKRATKNDAISVDAPEVEQAPTADPVQSKIKPRSKRTVDAQKKVAESDQSKIKVQSKRTSDTQTPDTQKSVNEKQRVCQQWFDKLYKRGLRSLRKDFHNTLRFYQPDLPTDACKEEMNRPKNRYDDVLLNDNTRVKIKDNPDGDDYIHASYVEVSPGFTYICAQGPLAETVQNFWLMCFQEDSKVILQLCQNVEDDNEKCVDYLPSGNDWTEFGVIKVKLLKKGAAVPGVKKVTKTMVVCRFKDKETTITHLLYEGWPDHSAPESVAMCREVRTLVNSLSKKKPIVLHCSAGIGRTGTFVAIEMVYHKLLTELKSDFDMVELIKELRNKRRHAIQNDLQYSYIFRGVIDILIAEQALTNTPEVVKFISDYDKMAARKKTTKRVKQSNKPTAEQAEEN